MPRIVWIGLICAVAFVLYTNWQRSQVPRVPITGSGTSGAPAAGGGGWRDSLGRIAEKLLGSFTSKDTAAPSTPAASSSSGVAWV